MTRPVESSITRRRMRSTMDLSWVATITVVPVRLMRYRSCMIPIDVSGSRLPVGSAGRRSVRGVGGAGGGRARGGGGGVHAGAPDEDTLLLAARELVGVVVQLRREPRQA